MRRLVYRPEIEVFIRSVDRNEVFDVSNDIVTASVTRRLNAISSATLELQNRNGRYTHLLKPMDVIAIFMTRMKRQLVFTGYLDSTPLYQHTPGAVSLQASCTLKLLKYTYFDPGLPFFSKFIHRIAGNKFLYDFSTGQLINSMGAFGDFDLNSGWATVLRAVLTEPQLGNWRPKTVHITSLPQKFLDNVTLALQDAGVQSEQDFSQLNGLLKAIMNGGADSVINAPAAQGATSADFEAALDASSIDWDGNQKHNASIIWQVAKKESLSDLVALGLIATAYAESTLIANQWESLTKSVGLFQLSGERWFGPKGLIAQMRKIDHPNQHINPSPTANDAYATNPEYNTRAFIRANIDINFNTINHTDVGRRMRDIGIELKPIGKTDTPYKQIIGYWREGESPTRKQSEIDTADVIWPKLLLAYQSLGSKTSVVSGQSGVGSGTVAQGSSQQLAEQLLTYVPLYYHGSSNEATPKDEAQIQKVADGELLHNTIGGDVPLDPRVLQALLCLIVPPVRPPGPFKIETFALVENHTHQSGINPHAQGLAVDISVINGHVIGFDGGDEMLTLVKAVLAQLADSGLAFGQVISGGIGGTSNAELRAISRSMSSGGLSEELLNDHRDHIHVGFMPGGGGKVSQSSTIANDSAAATNKTTGGLAAPDGTTQDGASPGFAVGILAAIGAPLTAQNIAFLQKWHSFEQNTHQTNNPLGTTLFRPIAATVGTGSTNSDGVQSFSTPAAGAAATKAFLNMPNYTHILAALMSGNPVVFAQKLARTSPGSNVYTQIHTWGSHNFATYLSGGGTPPTTGVTTSTTLGGGDLPEALFTLQTQAVDSVLSSALQGKKALANDISLFDWFQSMTTAGGRVFTSLPNGDFYAFFPDYFGWFGERTAYYQIEDIEIVDLTIQMSDADLATHVFATGTTISWQDAITEFDRLFPQVASVEEPAFNIFINPVDPDTGVSAPFDSATFLNRFGARPVPLDAPQVRHPLLLWMAAWMKFAELWAGQFSAETSLTFMPELFPGGLVSIGNRFTMFIEEVTHTMDRTSGYTTDAVLKSPSGHRSKSQEFGPLLLPDAFNETPTKPADAKGTKLEIPDSIKRLS